MKFLLTMNLRTHLKRLFQHVIFSFAQLEGLINIS